MSRKKDFQRCTVYRIALCVILCGLTRFTDAHQNNSSKSAGTWTTATLGVPRGYLAATSLPNYGLVFFAGGISSVDPCVGLDNVDIFNATNRTWSAAVLSAGRLWLAAASLPGLAFFAGGIPACSASPYDVVDIFNATSGSWSTAALSLGRWSLSATSLPRQGLIFFAGGHPDAGKTVVATIDIFNSTSQSWNTVNLSIARSDISASSLPSQGLAFFAGGQLEGRDASNAVDIFDAKSGSWSTAVLRVARWALAVSSFSELGLVVFAGGAVAINTSNPDTFSNSKTVDIYKWSDGSWSNIFMSEARSYLMSATLPNYALAIIAGGTASGPFVSVDTVDIFDANSGFWSTAILSAPRQCLAAASLPDHGLAIFAGGLQSTQRLKNGSLVGIFSNVVDMFSAASSPPSTTPTQQPSSADASTAPVTTYAPNATDSLSPVPASSIPTWIAAGAAVTTGHTPRALELFQFLAVLCTSLSSKQQYRVSEFQIASFTHVTSSNGLYCNVCPGSCVQPSVLLMPTFAFMSSLFFLGLVVVLVDAFRTRKHDSPGYMQDRLLAADSVSNEGRTSLGRSIVAFCIRYFRGFIETCSSYALVPCAFVFVLNAQPSTFRQTEVFDRLMIISIPLIALLFRIIVIRQRVVQLSNTDQKQLYVSSVCSVAVAVVFGLFFNGVRGTHQSMSMFDSATPPQYIVFALLASQLIAQTVIRLRATEASIFDKTDWPWSSVNSPVSSETFFSKELPARLLMGSIKSASATAALVLTKFLLLNYLVLSQMAMVVVSLASSGANTSLSIENASILIGTIPLISSGALFLYNIVNFIRFLWHKWFSKETQAGSRRSSKDSFL